MDSKKVTVQTNNDRDGVKLGIKGVTANGQNNNSSIEVEVDCNDNDSDAGNEHGGEDDEKKVSSVWMPF
ncbi:MAG: hypothetical protein OXG15_01705 [Gammaproteobacteria bacterium]|nr:hypothetical protein [Gammaproteobacteria bacterium]